MAGAWRIAKEKHSAAAFSGKGAFEFGGCWNSPGVSVVYTSSTKALAALECLVHLNPPVKFRYVAFQVTIQNSLIEVLPEKDLPKDWQLEPPGPSTQQIGDLWVRQARSAALAVPSVIIPSETNYLLNPSHPDFIKISIGKAEAFAFDPRLLD
jgi:RES domain-containing protein